MASAANTIPAPGDASSAGAQTTIRPNAVALEVPVNATGTRPSDVPGQRDLFTEETSTVLVFKDGAVIRLSAAVALGQLVFLTHKQTKREVVCQVLRKRSFRPTSCYVELDFTEEIADFWGVEFPEETAGSAAATAVAPAVTVAEEMVTSAETTADDTGPQPPPAPSVQEVDQLRQEVETLRSQLQWLLEAKGSTAKMAPAEAVAPVRAETPEWARAVTEAVLNKAAREEEAPQLMKPTEPAPVVRAEEPPVGAATAPTSSAVARAGMKQVPATRFAAEEAAIAQAAAAETESMEGLLPQPSLDFSKAPKAGTRASAAEVSQGGAAGSARGRGGKMAVVAALGVALLAMGGAGAWYKDWLPFLPRTKDVAAGVGAPRVQPVKPAGALGGVASGENTAGAAPSPKADAAAADSAPATGVGSGASGIANPAMDSGAGAGSPAGKVASSDVAAGNGAAAERAESAANPGNESEKSAASVGARKRSRTERGAAPETAAPVAAVNDGSVVPAKLLKSVNAVYPPDAMRNYITGDVIVDAVVQPNGRVGVMKVMTGPAPLRQAAIDALKQYQYAPATQGGKALASHVTVTVKFWFNP